MTHASQRCPAACCRTEGTETAESIWMYGYHSPTVGAGRPALSVTPAYRLAATRHRSAFGSLTEIPPAVLVTVAGRGSAITSVTSPYRVPRQGWSVRRG